jgi:hypothetical protein
VLSIIIVLAYNNTLKAYQSFFKLKLSFDLVVQRRIVNAMKLIYYDFLDDAPADEAEVGEYAGERDTLACVGEYAGDARVPGLERGEYAGEAERPCVGE